MMDERQQKVIDEVSCWTGISVGRILSRSREVCVVRARYEVMKRLYALNYTMPEIARAIGRDPSTVSYAIGNKRKKPDKPRRKLIRYAGYDPQEHAIRTLRS